jgi:hypothetical protein
MQKLLEGQETQTGLPFACGSTGVAGLQAWPWYMRAFPAASTAAQNVPEAQETEVGPVRADLIASG